MTLQIIHIVAGARRARAIELAEKLRADFEVNLCSDWAHLPGDNRDPKLLLKPTTPVIALVDRHELERLPGQLELLKVEGIEQNKRHPVLFLVEPPLLAQLQHHVHIHDDCLSSDCELDTLKTKLWQMVARADSHKKLARDLNEASSIALLSMSHSSELGEISRFILNSYQCATFEALFRALFEVTQTFMLECSALIVVDDSVVLETSGDRDRTGVNDTLLKHHGTKRVISLGRDLIISYEHASLMIHNMPVEDLARHGRLTDNMAVLGHCFEARVRGIEAEQKAEAANQAKTMFLATMSHELRTPLNAVIGYTGRLIKKLSGRLSDKEAKQLEAIRRNGDHLLQLINDVLDLSKIEAGQMEVHLEMVDVSVLLREIYDQLLPIAQSNHLAFDLELASDHLRAEVDPKRFTQIVMNLVSNAIKYTREGSVRLALNLTEYDCVGQGFEVAVSDTGIGISAHDQARLFENFVQIDSALSRKVEGSGLGLAISAFFAKQHGGRIDIDSQLGTGSRFTLLLPLSPHEVPALPSESSLSRSA